MTAAVAAYRSRDLEVLYRTSLAVQRVVRDERSSPHRGDVVAMGADGTPTEELDRIAESAILRHLDVEGVDWNVVSEEAGRVERGGSQSLVVDPIDGTSNAVRNLPFSTVSLALGEGDLGGVEIGLVRDLDRGTTYWAARGRGAFRDGRPIRTRPWGGKGGVVFANLGHVASDRTGQLVAHARRVRSLGCASLEMIMVAEGGGDAYFFENSTDARNLRATDIAAAYRILLEAGGGASDTRGGSLESFPLGVDRRTTVLAWGDPEFPRALRAEGAL